MVFRRVSGIRPCDAEVVGDGQTCLRLFGMLGEVDSQRAGIGDGAVVRNRWRVFPGEASVCLCAASSSSRKAAFQDGPRGLEGALRKTTKIGETFFLPSLEEEVWCSGAG